MRQPKTKRFYLDTSIWRDYFEDRSDGIKPLGEFAFRFLENAKKQRCELIIAEPVLFELQDFPKPWLDELFASYEELMVEVPTTFDQVKEAKRLSKERGLPFNDVFHAIVARDNDALMVTRDKHFEELADIVESSAPEDLAFP